jgi:hypothetical protein
MLMVIDELPYIMSLVRQSYERQMGDGGPQCSSTVSYKRRKSFWEHLIARQGPRR